MKLTITLKDGTTDFAYVSDETLDQLVKAIKNPSLHSGYDYQRGATTNP